MSRVTDNGLPHSVNKADDLPKHAYDGHLCFVVGDGLYVFNGTAYKKLGGAGTSGASGFTIPSYATVSAFPEGTAGQLAYAVSTKAVYFYNGSAWTKIGTAS